MKSVFNITCQTLVLFILIWDLYKSGIIIHNYVPNENRPINFNIIPTPQWKNNLWDKIRLRYNVPDPLLRIHFMSFMLKSDKIGC
jgi:hypothetical protein